MSLKVYGTGPVAFERTRLQSKLELHTSVLSQTISNESSVHTVVESFQFIAGNFRIVHALQERLDTGIFLSPEIVGNYISQLQFLGESIFY